MLGTLGRAKLHAYCSSKSAIIGLTRSLAAELGKDSITANVIAPGYFVTDINASLTSRPGYVEAVDGVTPMHRWGRPEELVGTLIYLASAASSFVTGQVIHVDGGLSVDASPSNWRRRERVMTDRFSLDGSGRRRHGILARALASKWPAPSPNPARGST